MKNTSKPTKSERQRLINRKRESNGNATNHKRTKTSNQTEGHRHNNQQTNANQHKKLKNLEPIYKSNPKQQTEQRQIGQSMQHNKKRMQSKEKIKNKHKQTHKSPTTFKLSRELQNNTQSWNITPPALGSLLDQLAGPARPGRQRISPAGGSAKKGEPPRGSRRQLGLITHAFISTLQAMFKKSSLGKGFRARLYFKHCPA